MNKMKSMFLTTQQLEELNFKSLGKNVSISSAASIVFPENISIGNNVRIDDFVHIIAPSPGFLNIGNYVHIGAGAFLGCAGGIELLNFSGISQGVRIHSASDDYSGLFLTNPTVPRELRRIETRPVSIGEHAIAGSGAVILPGANLETGVALGALSVAHKSLKEWGIYAGNPAKLISARSKNLLRLAALVDLQ